MMLPKHYTVYSESLIVRFDFEPTAEATEDNVEDKTLLDQSNSYADVSEHV